jgi:hypothetical protein
MSYHHHKMSSSYSKLLDRWHNSTLLFALPVNTYDYICRYVYESQNNWKVLKISSSGCTAHCAYRNVFPSRLSVLKVCKNDASAQIQIKLKCCKIINSGSTHVQFIKHVMCDFRISPLAIMHSTKHTPSA